MVSNNANGHFHTIFNTEDDDNEDKYSLIDTWSATVDEDNNTFYYCQKIQFDSAHQSLSQFFIYDYQKIISDNAYISFRRNFMGWSILTNQSFDVFITLKGSDKRGNFPFVPWLIQL